MTPYAGPDEIENPRHARHAAWRTQAPMVLVAQFGSLAIGLDDRGLHVALLFDLRGRTRAAECRDDTLDVGEHPPRVK